MSDEEPIDSIESTEQINEALFPNLTLDHVTIDLAVKTDSYKHKSLDYHTGQIRLIEILSKGDEDGQIRCRTCVCDLATQPRFIALSYVWGSPPAQHAIELDKQPFFVRKNLWRFLKHARKLKEFSDELFWIDAICIDQENPDERTHQVSLMSRIYKGAYKVLAWLGPDYDRSDEAMRYLSRSTSATGNKLKVSRVWSSACGMALSELCARPYWKRLWIFQELLLAHKIEVMCGDQVIDWNTLQRLLLTTNHATTDTRLMEKLAYKNTKNSPATTIVLQMAQDTEQRSLLKLILATRDLRCTETRDKAYGLLGVATIGHLGITADYSLPIEILLNRILRGHYTSRGPKSIAEIRALCTELSSCFGTDINAIFKFHSSYEGYFRIFSSSDVAFVLNLDELSVKTLLWAAFYDHTLILKTVIKEVRNKSPNPTIDVLKKSADTGNETVVRILLAIDADFKVLEHYDLENAFFSAIKNGYLSIVNLLIWQRHMNSNLRNVDGNTALQVASKSGHAAIVSTLINTEGAEINTRDNEGRTALHLAAREGHAAVVSTLIITEGAEVNTRDNEGRTALHLAAREGHAAVVSTLINTGGAEVNTRDNEGRTALHLAAQEGCVAVISRLISTGRAEINARASEGYTALHLAAWKGYTEVVYILINTEGAEINTRDNGERTALHLAAQEGCVAVISRLISTGRAEINARASEGYTALHLAAREGHAAVVSMLINTKGAEVNARDNKGRTTLHLAAEKGYTAVISMLINTGGANINEKDDKGRTTLHMAAWKGYTEVVSTLINTEGAEINARDSIGRTALHIAVLGGHKAVISTLIDTSRAQVDIQDHHGNTPHSYAANMGYKAAILALLKIGTAL